MVHTLFINFRMLVHFSTNKKSSCYVELLGNQMEKQSVIWLSYGVLSRILVWAPDWMGCTLRNTYLTVYILRFSYEIIFLILLLSDIRKVNIFELLSKRGRGPTWYVDLDLFQEVLEFLDEFLSHEFESCGIEMRVKRNMISAKKDSKTSHANQAYDQLITNN